VHAAGKADEVLTIDNLAEAYGVAAFVDYNAHADSLQVTAVECLSQNQTIGDQKNGPGLSMEENS
jgi:ABC-type cobalamin transport system ATPase subunit